MTSPTYIDVAPVTRTHEVLLELGHRVTRQVNSNGSLGAYTILANPERADRWGVVSAADWALCDAAEAAPLYGPRRAVYRPAYKWLDRDAPDIEAGWHYVD